MIAQAPEHRIAPSVGTVPPGVVRAIDLDHQPPRWRQEIRDVAAAHGNLPSELSAQAAAAKALAGVEAASLIESAAAALAAIEIKAGQARRLRGIKLDTTSVIASIVEVRAMIESARVDHAALSYASSRAKAAAAGARIQTLDGVISEAMLIARKK